MAFCMNCGFKLPANAKFCFECGAKQEMVGDNTQTIEKEKPFVAIFDNEETSGYYEEENGADLTSAYNKESQELSDTCSSKKKGVSKQSSRKQEDKNVILGIEPVQNIEDVEEDVEEDLEEDANVFNPNLTQPQDKQLKTTQPPTGKPIVEIEEDVCEEEIDEYNSLESTTKKSDLTKLSSFVQEDKHSAENVPLGFSTKELKPVIDPYWDDVKPEIDNEIYQIDKSIIFKGAVSVLALFGIIIYLIYMM